jgi:MFS family permease
LPLTIAVVAPFSGALADRIGSRWLAAGGLALASVGLLLLTRLDADSTLEQIVGCLMLTGLRQGMFQSPNTRAFMNAAPAGQQGKHLVCSPPDASWVRASAWRSPPRSSPVLVAHGQGSTLAAARGGGVAPTHVITLQHTFLEAPEPRSPRGARPGPRSLGRGERLRA